MKNDQDMSQTLNSLLKGSPNTWPKSLREVNLYGSVPAATEERILEAIRTAQVKKTPPVMRTYFFAAAAALIAVIGSIVVWRQMQGPPQVAWKVKAAEKTLSARNEEGAALDPVDAGRAYSGKVTVLPTGYVDITADGVDARITGPATLRLGKDITVTQGTLWVSGTGAAHRIRIVTPTASLEMTGTAGRITVSQESTQLDVLEGAFNVQGSGAPVTVSAGNAVQATKEGTQNPRPIAGEQRASLENEFAVIRSGQPPRAQAEDEETGRVT
ncbi:MAG: hypothetical protein HY042_09145, partial [Spirochaetia bacterium]|nr:hypothetical protein [Spirochaetia bacterium]